MLASPYPYVLPILGRESQLATSQPRTSIFTVRRSRIVPF
jgi:hypothetical protein